MGADAPRWLSADAAASHLCMTLDGFRRLVRDGRLPSPSRALGDRFPRWDRQALDSRMGGGLASLDPERAAEALAQEIAQGR